MAQQHIPSRRRRALRALLTVALLALSACTGSTDGKESGSESSPASAPASGSSASSAGAEQIAAAKRQAAQYDYDTAIQTLAGVDGDEAKKALEEIQAAKAKAVQWSDNTAIPHIFYHSLIVDPVRAFKPGSEGEGFSQYMVTVSEFTKQLQQLYDKGWVMVHPQRIASPDANGAMVPTPIVLPPGKKPFILSQDDVSYYEYMAGKGFADNLFVAADGRVLNHYTDAAGVTTEGSYDVVPIVDDFVREHPDFSYRGDKGTLAMTGYNGLFGYRSSVQSYGDTPQTHQAMADAKVVADAIKADGWMFAYHSWGHINYTQKDMSWISTDMKYWEQECVPVLGETPIEIFAFGADIGGEAPYSPSNPKFQYLHGEKKFSYFFNVKPDLHWIQINSDYVRGGRINIDGLTIQGVLDGYYPQLAEFFDVKSTIDPARPLPVPQPGQGGPKAGGN